MFEEEMLKLKIWAVVGANSNPNKFGHRIYSRLKKFDYTTYAVNPTLSLLDGDHVYPSLSDLPQKPDVLDMVVGPSLSVQYLREAAALGIENIWFQPGSYTQDVLVLATELGLKWVEACVLVAIRKPWPGI